MDEGIFCAVDFIYLVSVCVCVLRRRAWVVIKSVSCLVSCREAVVFSYAQDRPRNSKTLARAAATSPPHPQLGRSDGHQVFTEYRSALQRETLEVMQHFIPDSLPSDLSWTLLAVWFGASIRLHSSVFSHLFCQADVTGARALTFHVVVQTKCDTQSCSCVA